MLGVGVPVGTIIYWMAQTQHTTLPAAATLASATWTTVSLSAWGAAVAVVFALPVALLGFRRRSATRDVLERSTYVTKALPGVVIALSLVFFATRYAFGLYETSVLLVAAYAMLNFPLALVCVKASVTQIPPRLVDVGRSLGRGPLSVFLRVTLPLLAPGLLAGFCLVFLTAVTELTATLVLAPIGVQTLATQFWAFQQNIAYGAAAPYALVMVVLALVPGACRAYGLTARDIRAPRHERSRSSVSGQAIRRDSGPHRRRADRPRGVHHRRPRRLGQRQDHAAAADRRVRAARPRQPADRRAGDR